MSRGQDPSIYRKILEIILLQFVSGLQSLGSLRSALSQPRPLLVSLGSSPAPGGHNTDPILILQTGLLTAFRTDFSLNAQVSMYHSQGK